MPSQSAVVITGANGEIGHALIERLTEHSRDAVIAMDLRDLDASMARRCAQVVVGDVTDAATFERVGEQFDVRAVYHLAAMLSTSSEKQPERAQSVNVDGTLRALTFAMSRSARRGERVSFLFPSSIAAYGVPSLDEKRRAGAVDESQFNTPTTMYGVNKLYGEHLGRYYARHYRQLAQEPNPPGIDFRSIRFPGIISAFTVPSGGTSDYLPEMLHAAAQSKDYACFVRADTRIPFMAMPDAVDALLGLAAADASKLSSVVYNVTAFNPSPEEFSRFVLRAFPKASVSYAPHAKRQGIVDTWPEQLDDSLARKDWSWSPKYSLERMIEEYLLPNVRKRYA
ncbi:MAG: NAD-dependent epimerase/dehydratase family protein [Myxococcales bacterium]|nr:NAD-dependent epimerase/dehydratase family protein [Myxococcales bacterium]